MVDRAPLLHVTTRSAWRAWLAAHHATAKEAWLVFAKAHTGKPGIPYAAAVEEALCFGWIDSIIRCIDDETYARKFTPRRHGSVWSAINKQRVRRLIAAGRMTAAGRAKLNARALEPAAAPEPPRPRLSALEPPPYLVRALRKHPPAWTTFVALAPSCRGAYIYWIAEAKREETRKRRIREAVALLVAGKKLPLK